MFGRRNRITRSSYGKFGVVPVTGMVAVSVASASIL